MIIFGHRGASGHAPENTLSAFNLAFKHNADGIETDIIQHKNHCYAMHDLRVDRTTNGTGYLWDYDHNALLTLDAGEGQSIPILEQVIRCTPTGRKCNLEIKYLQNADLFSKQLSSALKVTGFSASNIIISSFHHPWLQEIGLQCQGVTYASLIAHYPINIREYLKSLYGDMVNVALDVVDSKVVDTAHALNKSVCVYTVNNLQDMVKCKAMGVDGIFTNYPKLARTIS